MGTKRFFVVSKHVILSVTTYNNAKGKTLIVNNSFVQQTDENNRQINTGINKLIE